MQDALHQHTGHVGVIEGDLAAHTGAADDDRAVGGHRSERGIDEGLGIDERADQHGRGLSDGLQNRAGAVRGREDEAVALALGVLRRRVAQIEALNQYAVALAAEQHALGALSMGVLDLPHARDRRVAGVERVRDRRGCADAVDDDRDVGGSGIARIECDVQRVRHLSGP